MTAQFARRALSVSLLALGIAAGTPRIATAQAPEFTLENVLTRGREFEPQLPVAAWITGTESFSVVQTDESGETVVRYPIDGSLHEEMFDLAALEVAVGVDEGSLTSLPSISWLGPETVRFEHDDAVWHWNLAAADAIRVLPLPADARARAIGGPDARAAFVVDDDLWIVTRGEDGRHRVTWDGAAQDIVYGGAAHRAEFGIRTGLWWDPTGRRLAFSREDMRAIAPYPYAEFDAFPPAPRHGRYPMAGSDHSRVTIGVWDSADRSLRWLEHDPDADVYWTNVTFSPDGSRVFVALVSRGQDHAELVEFDAVSGKRTRSLFSESDPEWVEPEMGPIFVPPRSDAEPDGRFLWFSPRDGSRNLYEYAADGSLIRQLTTARFDLRAFGGFTGDGAGCYVTGSGDHPLQMHLWRVDLADGAMTQVTQGDGQHGALVSDSDHVLDHAESASNPGTLTLIPRHGERRVVSRATDPLADRDTGSGEFFTIEADDGQELHGYVLRPPGFDPSQKYPLLHYVYGGPHSQLVRDVHGHGANLWLRWMASQGYVVSCLDNRGTDNRGIEFAQCVHRRLGVLEVADQLAAVRHLIGLGFIDPARVGVHGWSYGGYMTLRLMLMAPSTFAAGVSGAPVTDWAHYETGYTERYMDTPAENPTGFEASSVLPLVGALEGRLLLVTPTNDETVMTSHSMAFLRRCVETGTLVDHMAYPMQVHGLRGQHRTHFYRLMTRHFAEHLAPRTHGSGGQR